jgi:hypothetical protein
MKCDWVIYLFSPKKQKINNVVAVLLIQSIFVQLWIISSFSELPAPAFVTTFSLVQLFS